MSSLQIYQWVCQWKNFENRLTFGEVMGKSLVSCFFETQCIYIRIWRDVWVKVRTLNVTLNANQIRHVRQIRMCSSVKHRPGCWMKESVCEHSAKLETIWRVVELGWCNVGFHLDVGRQALVWWLSWSQLDLTTLYFKLTFCSHSRNDRIDGCATPKRVFILLWNPSAMSVVRGPQWSKCDRRESGKSPLIHVVSKY